MVVAKNSSAQIVQRYLPVQQDFAVVVDRSVAAADVEAALRGACKVYGLPVSGKKADVIERLIDHIDVLAWLTKGATHSTSFEDERPLRPKWSTS